MLRHITGLILLLASTNALCQNIQSATIEWTCNSTFTAQPGTFSEEITKVVSSPGEITWYDPTGSVRETFTITGTTGSWSNVSSNGSIQFTVHSGDNRGTAQFSKANGITTIRLMIISGTDTQIYELNVTTKTAL